LEGINGIRNLEGIQVVGEAPGAEAQKSQAAAIIFQTEVDRFFQHEETLTQEVFGPSSVVLKCQAKEEMLRFAKAMEGSLSATVHGTEEDLKENRDLLDILETRTGRVIYNGFPTGLEVCTAMHHGGPYPAATHSFFTSVGTNAIYRFVRPVCYQDLPQFALPPELQDSNPLGVHRMLNAEWTAPK
ncbi:MAG: aldehyde dehydrogenase (NADP(+)), partial [Verrucomicrobiota bacterium]